MRAVIDTCVIVDALQSREPFCKDAQSIFLLCANRQTHSDKATCDVLTKLCALFGLLDTTALDIRKAISAEISDFEDAVMVETAVHSGVDCIVTRNTKDYAKAQIAVCTPEEFIQQINEDTACSLNNSHRSRPHCSVVCCPLL